MRLPDMEAEWSVLIYLFDFIGEPGWDRTIDTVIKSHVLYH